MTVKLTIVTRQRVDGQEDESHFSTVADLTRRGTLTRLSYLNQPEEGGAVPTAVTVTPHEVTVTWEGEARHRLRFRPGERCHCEYPTPYGTIPMVTHTHTLRDTLAAAGTLLLEYDLAVGSGEPVHNRLEFQIFSHTLH